MLFEMSNQEPILTIDESTRVNDVLQWAWLHDNCTFYDVLGSVPRLMEFVYVPAGYVSVKLLGEVAMILVNPSPPAANTRGATPKKGKAQAVDKGKSKAVDKGKSKVVDKGKGKMIELEKPEFIPLQTGEAFKIYEPKDPTPQHLQLLSQRRRARL